MTNPSVTALVSAYYAEKFLRGRLDNLLEQTLVPEIVVVCQNGSAEEAIALEYNSRICSPMFTVISTLGIPTIYDAWNQAIAVAHGEFLTNANCDDRLRPTALEILSVELRKHPKYSVAYGDQEVTRTLDGPITGRYSWLEGGFPELLSGCFVGPMPLWRRSLHDTYGLFDDAMHIAGDYEFWLRIASHGERLLHLRAVVGTYLKRNDSAEHRESLRAAWETARARARYRKEEK